MQKESSDPSLRALPDDGSESVRRGNVRSTGLRLSFVDVVVLVVAAITTIVTWSWTEGWSLLVAFVVGHFFLFCNVFRIRRKMELWWAALFVINGAVQVAAGSIAFGWLCGLQCLVTVIVLFIELRHPSYHGIFAERWNRHLVQSNSVKSSDR